MDEGEKKPLRGKGTGRVGHSGEDAAARWLEEHGFRIVDRNWRSSHLEIDIIAESREALHIVEVKTDRISREAASDTDPSSRVGKSKQARLISAARRYASENHVQKEIFFDVIAVHLDASGEPLVEYLPRAFYPIVRYF